MCSACQSRCWLRSLSNPVTLRGTGNQSPHFCSLRVWNLCIWKTSQSVLDVIASQGLVAAKVQRQLPSRRVFQITNERERRSRQIYPSHILCLAHRCMPSKTNAGQKKNREKLKPARSLARLLREKSGGQTMRRVITLAPPGHPKDIGFRGT